MPTTTATPAQRKAERTLLANFEAHPSLQAFYLRWTAGQLPETDARTTGFIDDVLRKATRYALSERQVAAVTSAAAKSEARAAEDAERAAASPSRHVSTIGTRLRDFAVTITGVRPVPSRGAIIIEATDQAGDVFNVWADEDRADAFAEGQTYRITGTVRGHGTWQGIQTTTLNRVKWGQPVTTDTVAHVAPNAAQADALAAGILTALAGPPALTERQERGLAYLRALVASARAAHPENAPEAWNAAHEVAYDLAEIEGLPAHLVDEAMGR